jgi:integrase
VVSREAEVKMRIGVPHLADRDQRMALPRRHSPYWLPLRRGLTLGYYPAGAEGSWIVKSMEPGKPDTRKQQVLGLADDRQSADGFQVLTFETAQDLALRWKPRMEEPEATFPATMARPTTVAEAVLAHLTHLEREGRNTRKAQSMADCHILRNPIARIRLQDLTYSAIDNWKKALGESRKKNRNLKPGEDERLPLDDSQKTLQEKRARQCTTNRVLAFLKAALNRAQVAGRANRDPMWDRIDGSAWRQVQAYRGVNQSRTRFLDFEEQQKLVAACPDDLRRLVQAALATGARFGELARMTVSDVYLRSSTIMLQTSKTKTKRVIPILKESREFFKDLIAGKAPSDLLFTRTDAKGNVHAWGTNLYVRPLAIAIRKAAINRLVFHELRHSYASAMVMAGVTSAALARALGHVNEHMVLTTYGHLRADWATKDVLRKAPRLGIFKKCRCNAGK